MESEIYIHSHTTLLTPALAESLLAGPGASPGGRNLSGLLAFADSEPMPLRWGEVVPLSFLGARVNTSLPVPPDAAGRANVSVFSIPTKRYTADVAMVRMYRGLSARERKKKKGAPI